MTGWGAADFRHEVPGEVWIVGTAPDCDVRIDDEYVSNYPLGRPWPVAYGGQIRIGRTDMWRIS